MTVARGAVVGIFGAAIIAVVAIMFGSNGGRTYKLEFQNAGQLVKGNQVKVGGNPVGKITDISLSDNNQAQIEIQVDGEFGPLHRGTQATIRLTSLSSVASRYILLAPGPNSAPEIPSGGTIETDETTTVVDLDQLFNTLDPDTRKGLQQFIQGFGNWYAGRRADTSEASRYFGPALATFTEVEKQLIADQETFTKLIVEGSRALGAIAARRDDLANLVSNGNAMMRAIGAENVALAQALEFLPSTLRNGSSAFARLRTTLDSLTTLTEATERNLPGTAKFLGQLADLAANSRQAIRDFRYVVNTPGRNNDITDLTALQPRLTAVAGRSFKNARSALRASDPVINFIRPYAPEITAWLTDFGQTTAYYDANGHYARVSVIVNAFAWDQASNTLNALSPAERASIVQTLGSTKRCPGSQTQPAADGSNPYTEGGRIDCDPSAIPPGN